MLVRDVASHLGALEQYYAGLAARGWYGERVCCAVQPATVHGSPDTILAEKLQEGAQVIGSWAARLVESVHGLSTDWEIRAALERAAEEIDPTPLVDLLTETMVRAAMLGALDAQWEHETGEELEVTKFRTERPFTKLPRDEAVRFWESRKVLPPELFEQLTEGLKIRAFSFAGAATEELLATAHAELGRQLREGANLETFGQFAQERLESAGWTPASPTHVETIFRTNLGTAYASGRYAEMTQPDVLAALPYWQIRTVRDARQRPSHGRAHDIILPADHPFWLKAYPPFGYNCRCRVIARTKAWVDRNNARIGPVPRDLPDPGFDSGVAGLVGVRPALPSEPRRPVDRQPDAQRIPSYPTRPAPAPSYQPQQAPSPLPRPAPPRPRPAPAPPPPKPEPRRFVPIHGGRQFAELSPRQQEAERTARWLRTSPAARAVATPSERRTALIWEWTSGSNRRAAVVLKHAVKSEFRLEGDVWSRGITYRIAQREIDAVRRDARTMYERTQAYFRARGITRVKLYRGLKPGTAPHRNAVESWTSDPEIARQFAGPRGVVLEQEVPVSQVLTHHKAPGWVDGPYGRQSEYLVMR